MFSGSVIALNWVVILDLVTLIGGIIVGVVLASPNNLGSSGGRRY